MHGTIELIMTGFGGASILFFCLFCFLILGTTLQDDDDAPNDGGSTPESDLDFPESVEARFNDIIRLLIRRRQDAEKADEKDFLETFDEDGYLIFDEDEEDADDDELFASDEEEFEQDNDFQQEEPAPDGRANYSGAFFKNRNYPRDVYESEGEGASSKKSHEEPPRWKRAIDAGQDSSGSTEDDNINEREDVSDYEFESIENEIARLREELQNGDESSRIELVERLLEQATNERHPARFFKTLDEAQTLVDEAEELFDEEYEEAKCVIALQRAAFYVRNNQCPPFELVTVALRLAQKWRQKTDSPASCYHLARVWLLHGQSLLLSGASASALSSFQNARSCLNFATDCFNNDERNSPVEGYALVSEAEAYWMAGDADKAIATARDAAIFFDKFKKKRFYLAQKANALHSLGLKLRGVGRIEKALDAFRSASEAMERLFSYDPGRYFLKLARLLRSQAETGLSESRFEAAFALLDRAESILLLGLQESIVFKRRVFGYIQLFHTLCNRAELYYLVCKFDLSRRDILNALRYLSVAVEKDDDFNPGVGIVLVYRLIYDQSSYGGRLEVARRLYPFVEQVIAQLVVRDRRWALPYAELLLRMYMRERQEGRLEEALELATVAIRTLDECNEPAEGQNDVPRRELLVRTLYRRACTLCFLRATPEAILSDFNRIDAFLSETDYFPVAYTSLASLFSVEFFLRYSCALWVNDEIQKSYEAVRTACRRFTAELNAGSWTVVRALKGLVYVTLRLAEKSEQPILFFRLARFWTKYIRRLRRKFLQSDAIVANPDCLSVFDESDELEEADDLDDETLLNNLVLLELDESLLCVFMTRALFVKTCPWKTEYESFFSREKNGYGQAKRVEVGSEFDVLFHSDQDSFSEQFTSQVVYEAREKFVKEKLSSTANKLFYWYDLQHCARSVERQIELGDFSHMKTLVGALNALISLYWEYGETRLAVVELLTASHIVVKAAARQDSQFPFGLNEEAENTSKPVAFDETDWEEIDEFEWLFGNGNLDSRDSLFWSGAFLIELRLLVTIERLLLGKETSLLLIVDSLFDMKKESEFFLWLREYIEQDENETSKVASDVATIDDYQRLTSEQVGLLEKTFEVALACGRSAAVYEERLLLPLLVFADHHYKWLMARGHVDAAKAAADDQIDLLERVGEIRPLAPETIFFYRLMVDSAMKFPQGRPLARELALKAIALFEDSDQLEEGFAGSLRGRFYKRLATIATEESNNEEVSKFQREATDAFARRIEKVFLDEESFLETSQLLLLFFVSDEKKNVSNARKLLRRYEEAFDANLGTLEESRLEMNATALFEIQVAWAVFIQAAEYYAYKRKSFTEAKRLYHKAEETFDLLTNRSENFLSFDDYRFQASALLFYKNYNLAEETDRALRWLSSICRRELARLKKDESAGETIANFERLNLMLDCEAQGFSVFYGKFSFNPETFMETTARIKELQEYKDFTLLKRPKVSLFSIFSKKTQTESKEATDAIEAWGGRYFLSLMLSSYATYRQDGLASHKKRVRRILKDIRRYCSPKSPLEFRVLVGWADFLTSQKEWTTVIRVASYLNRNFLEAADADLLLRQKRLDALKFEALARIERGWPFDFVWAKKLVNVALKKCRDELAKRNYSFRASYAELIILQARLEKRRKRYESALANARRAFHLIEKCEICGISVRLLESRKYVELMIEELQSKVDGARNDASNLK